MNNKSNSNRNPLVAVLLDQDKQLRNMEISPRSDPHTEEISKDLKLMKEEMREQRSRDEADKKRESALQHRYTFLGAVYGVILAKLFDHWSEVLSFLHDVFEPIFQHFN